MATFAPSSQVNVCTVPIDITYRNQIYFATKAAQLSWFGNHTKFIFDDYLVVRKTLPNGSMQSSIKVEKNIDDLQDCNYMMYANDNHGTKRFFAFITKLIYINEETTEIVFETDVWQTWMFDVNIKESYVVREHSGTDEIGDNVVPEPFDCADYTFAYMKDLTPSGQWGYLVALSNSVDDSKYTAEGGKPISGIFQGLYFYYFSHEHADTQLPVFLHGLDIDSVQFIATVPHFCIPGEVGPKNDSDPVSPFYVQASDDPFSKEEEHEFDFVTNTFEGYSPKNKKLFTSPYIELVATDHAGKVTTYAVEHFKTIKKSEYIHKFTLMIKGDLSASPSIFVYPRYYKGLAHAIEYGFTLDSFPQCSYANDAYKLWLAKNQYSLGVSTASNAVGAMLGIGTIGYGTGMLGNPATAAMGASAISSGASQALNGITGILQNWASVKSAQLTANRTSMGCPKTNLLTAMEWNCISLYKRSIRYDHARCIDDYFTMYGYQTNRVKQPNLSSRPFFNYVQTNGVNIVGCIPNDDMTRLKRMFDEGVTMWKSHATVGDYSVDNSP